MRVMFRDLNPAVCVAMDDAFRGVAAFDIRCDDIFSAGPADAIISPANSYGRMDGGIDLAYLHYFGPDLEHRVKAAIQKGWSGRLPVGSAIAVRTESRPSIPWMISAPTMEVPGPVPLTRNAYLAFEAALFVARSMRFKSVLCPGLATLTGRMHPRDSAAQMREAWDVWSNRSV
jgi:O-acetyl-ADP-ribose deacetylase (regulator of RNase III)